jgi:hypothetical protein
MKNPHKSGSIPTDAGASHIEVRFYPYRDETQAVVVVAHGLGGRASRLRVWGGTLPCRRSDLCGMGSGPVTVLLAGLLRDALIANDAAPLAQGTDSVPAEPDGAPLGATGGTVIQDTLPFD